MKDLPFHYSFERLAQRWDKAPYEIERELNDPLVQQWVQRGLYFMRVEAESQQVKRGR